jgi:WD40 repeat protein
VWTFAGHSAGVRAVAITRDGRRAVSACSDKTLRIWDLESGRLLKILEGHSEWVRAVAITPDDRRAVSVSDDNTLRIWDLESGREFCSVAGDAAIRCCAIAPGSKTIIAGDHAGFIHILRLEGSD